MKTTLLTFFTITILLTGCKKDPNTSTDAQLTVSEITLSKGLVSTGSLEYYPKNQKMTVYVDITKNDKVSGTYTLRESTTLSAGTGTVVSTGSLDQSTTKKYLTLGYTPSQSTPTQLEIGVKAGSNSISKYKVIIVRDN